MGCVVLACALFAHQFLALQASLISPKTLKMSCDVILSDDFLGVFGRKITSRDVCLLLNTVACRATARHQDANINGGRNLLPKFMPISLFGRVFRFNLRGS